MRYVTFASLLFSGCGFVSTPEPAPAKPAPADPVAETSWMRYDHLPVPAGQQQPSVYDMKTAAPAMVSKGDVPAPSGPPPAPAGTDPSNFNDLVALMERMAYLAPTDKWSQVRLAAMLTLAERYEEARRVISAISPPASNTRLDLVQRLLHFAIRKQLGDHEADADLAALNDSLDASRGLKISKAVLCQKVNGFEDYVAFDGNHFQPGDRALIYMQVRNFTLKQEGSEVRFHLTYRWQLFDERGEDHTPAAWKDAPAAVREDHKTLHGRIRDFYQTFFLPFPNLPRGRYRIHIECTDALQGDTHTSYDLPVEMAEWYPRKE